MHSGNHRFSIRCTAFKVETCRFQRWKHCGNEKTMQTMFHYVVYLIFDTYVQTDHKRQRKNYDIRIENHYSCMNQLSNSFQWPNTDTNLKLKKSTKHRYEILSRQDDLSVTQRGLVFIHTGGFLLTCIWTEVSFE